MPVWFHRRQQFLPGFLHRGLGLLRCRLRLLRWFLLRRLLRCLHLQGPHRPHRILGLLHSRLLKLRLLQSRQ